MLLEFLQCNQKNYDRIFLRFFSKNCLELFQIIFIKDTTQCYRPLLKIYLVSTFSRKSNTNTAVCTIIVSRFYVFGLAMVISLGNTPVYLGISFIGRFYFLRDRLYLFNNKTCYKQNTAVIFSHVPPLFCIVLSCWRFIR